MFPLQPNRYLLWRAERLNGLLLGEKEEFPPESLLQQIWLYQRLIPEKLFTIQGQRVRVLHPGFWNKEPGPDFRRAIVQVGDAAPVQGDVELDLVGSGWEQHGHASNPAYGKVILHVTWETGIVKNNLPTLPVSEALDAPLKELAFWLGNEGKPPPENLAGKCSGPFRTMSDSLARDVLKQAGQARLQRKAEQLQARARQFGWNGALWEGLFAALGYKRNVWPMRRLSGLLELIRDSDAELLLLQARLLGLAGFLPQGEGSRLGKQSDYSRQLWDCWWREADQLRVSQLPGELWELGGIRPANHPQRRLALASHWLAQEDLPGKLEDWLTRTIESPDLVDSLLTLLQPDSDPFWSYRSTFRSAPSKTSSPLLGKQRLTDLAMNVILPWLYVRALAGQNKEFAQRAEARYFLWPKGEDNSVLRLARQRLFGAGRMCHLKSAAEQQAVMQIVRDFCDHSNANCDDCLFPGLLRAVAVRE